MPLYEFHCRQCDTDSEILVRSSDWTGTRCPKCGSQKLAKKFSTFASTGGGSAEAPACETGGGGCCGCAAGRPHRH